jgi:hypothetical protein
MSERGIEVGSRWLREIDDELEATDFGVLFVTPENQHEPWLVHEAGALGKSVDGSRVVPVAIDMDPTDIDWPLARFQGVELGRKGVRDLLDSMNSALGENQLDTEVLEGSFEPQWSTLKQKLEEIPDRPDGKPAQGERRDKKLDEILELVRGISRAGGESDNERNLFEHLLDRIDVLESRVTPPSEGIGELSVHGGHTSPGGVWTKDIEIFSPFDSLTQTAELVGSLTKVPKIKSATIDPHGIHGHAMKIEYSLSDLSPEQVMKLVEEHAEEIEKEEQQ